MKAMACLAVLATMPGLGTPAPSAMPRVDDARCTMTMQYTGTLLNGGANWIEGTAACEGTCPTSGACVLTAVSPPFGWTAAWVCACPSGGGTEGCKGTMVQKMVGEPPNQMNHEELRCAGACATGQVCDFLHVADLGNDKKKAKCSCQ